MLFTGLEEMLLLNSSFKMYSISWLPSQGSLVFLCYFFASFGNCVHFFPLLHLCAEFQLPVENQWQQLEKPQMPFFSCLSCINEQLKQEQFLVKKFNSALGYKDFFRFICDLKGCGLTLYIYLFQDKLMYKKGTRKKHQGRTEPEYFHVWEDNWIKKGFNHTHKSTSQHKATKVPTANTYTLLLSVS